MYKILGDIFIRRKIILVALLMFVLVSLTAVSAADTNQTDDITTEESNTVTQDILSDGNSDFNTLNDEINSITGNTFKLERNYKYDSEKDSNYSEGIEINKDNLIIDGQDHIIDASSKARIFHINAVNVTIKNIIFTNGASPGNGGAILIDKNTQNTKIQNSNFQANKANSGGAIYSFKDLTVTECQFKNNIAEYGGAINARENEVKINVMHSNFTDNSADADGGSVCCNDITTFNCKFHDNRASRDSGAIGCENITAINCEFTNNSAGADGGAIYSVGLGTIMYSSFNDNVAGEKGGAIMGFKLNIENSNFTANNAHKGGAILFSGKPLSIRNSCFNHNTASGDGGAVKICENSNDIQILNSEFKNNTANNGGAIMTQDKIENLNIINSTFTYNTASEKGGAGSINAKANIINSNFTNNRADVTGSALMIGGDSKITASNFNSNAAGDGSTDIVTIENCNITLQNLSPKNLTALIYVNLTATVKDVKYGNTVEIAVSAKDMNKGTVYITINNETYNADVINGTATIKIHNLTAGDYRRVKVTYNRSGTYTKSFDLVSFRVSKYGTAISAPSKSYVINYGGKYSITLKDETGTVLSGKSIALTIGGKDYNAVSGSDGVATFILTKAILKSAGTKSVTVKFPGDEKYISSTADIRITVQKEAVKILKAKKTYKFKRSKKSKNIQVTLKDSKNRIMKNVKVTLKLSGKNINGKKIITAKTGKKGVVTFKLGKKLTKKTKVKYTITYKGNSYYNKVIKKGKIQIK